MSECANWTPFWTCEKQLVNHLWDSLGNVRGHPFSFPSMPESESFSRIHKWFLSDTIVSNIGEQPVFLGTSQKLRQKRFKTFWAILNSPEGKLPKRDIWFCTASKLMSMNEWKLYAGSVECTCTSWHSEAKRFPSRCLTIHIKKKRWVSVLQYVRLGRSTCTQSPECGSNSASCRNWGDWMHHLDKYNLETKKEIHRRGTRWQTDK